MTGLIHEPLFTIEQPVITPTPLEIIDQCIDDIRAGKWTTVHLEYRGQHCAIGLVGKNGDCYEPALPAAGRNEPWISYPDAYSVSWTLEAMRTLTALQQTIPRRNRMGDGLIVDVYRYNDHLGHVPFGQRGALKWFLRARKQLVK